MTASTDILHALRERGFVQQISDEPGLAALLGKGQVTFYAGFDPTAASLHVGSMIPLMAMAHLTRAGHRAIGVLGGGTAMVGDPSGRTELRQMMTIETIQANRRSIEPQVRRFVAGADAVIVDNAEWLAPLNYLEFLRDIGRHFSVNRMLTAEAYRQRMEKGLSFIEFNYQILQAYDYLILHRKYGCALQVGGDDQWGNILAGTDLIRRLHQAETYALTFPLITTATGAKMGKTAAGAVWLAADRTSPYDFYQYFVNVDDRDVSRFLKLLTFLPMDEIARLSALEGSELRVAKQALAFEVTSVVHGKAEADKAQQAAQAVFGTVNVVPASIVAGAPIVGTPTISINTLPTFEVNHSALAAGMKTVDLIAAAGLAASKSAARRLVEQGGVRLGERKVSAVDDAVQASEIAPDGTLLYVGKKHIRRIVIKR